MREAEEVERLRLAQTPLCSAPGSTPPKLDQPRLVRMQVQPEPRQPLTKLDQEPPRILFILEPDDEVVSEPHDDHITVRVPASPPVDPLVEDIVQVHVREQRRSHAPNAMGNFCFEVTLSYRRLEKPRRVLSGL